MGVSSLSSGAGAGALAGAVISVVGIPAVAAVSVAAAVAAAAAPAAAGRCRGSATAAGATPEGGWPSAEPPLGLGLSLRPVPRTHRGRARAWAASLARGQWGQRGAPPL